MYTNTTIKRLELTKFSIKCSSILPDISNSFVDVLPNVMLWVFVGIDRRYRRVSLRGRAVVDREWS
jgi:hypothetical protein